MILVVGDELIQGNVADCPARGSAAPPPPAETLAGSPRSDGGISPDGTLEWRWEHHPDGSRRVAARYLLDGRWQDAMTQDWPAPRRTD
ncbi:hypothetical protein J4558_15880 [Leptolyngbya sp. 15MV]|nr:hypothetical protein J4558_15880 [Leptolyngbya sp. 15MV]